ncbi:MAG: NAD(P)-binding protein [Firmicutes bacterium]|nr:NAD(P)-binding protein [Bacillota bacterium]
MKHLYNNIFSPQKINSLHTINRLVFGPHRLNFAEGHVPGQRRLAYYEERAQGGVGLIIMEGSMILPQDYPYATVLNIHEPSASKSYALIAQTLKRYPLLLIGQLNHYGGQGNSEISRRPLLAPSPIPEINTNAVPKIADDNDLALLIEGFTIGARLLIASGFDGVEINVAQYSLLRQFLSPLTNLRDDAYGGVLENRAKLPLQIIKSVRQELGQTPILGLRLCGDEYAPWGGLGPQEWAKIAAYLCESIQIDYIAVENGSLYSSHKTFAGIQEPEDYAVIAAKQIGLAVKKPVIVGGSLQSPDLIESIVAEQTCLADITRALISDPYYPQKLAAGLSTKIKPCILCRSGCYTHTQTNNPIACSVNPRAGCEGMPGIETNIFKQDRGKKLAVAGAGAAGLQAALRAAEKGALVTLYEEQAHIGGLWRLYSKSQPRLEALIDYYLRMLRLLNVEIKLNQAFCAQHATDYDAVIIAVGALPQREAVLPQADMLHTSAVQYLHHPQPAKHAVVYDKLGNWQAQLACRKLATLGAHIDLVSPDSYLAALDTFNGDFIYWYEELAKLPIQTYKQKTLGRIFGAEIILHDQYSGAEELLSEVDMLIEASAGKENLNIYQQLLGSKINVLAVGDCVAPRNLASAIREGDLAAEEVWAN